MIATVRKKTSIRLISWCVEFLFVLLLLLLAFNCALQRFDVIGPSMEPQLHNNESMLVDKISYLFREPQRGDVVVFVAPPQPNMNYVKRIIGLPGDVISIENGRATVNGVRLHEFYVEPRRMGAAPGDKQIHSLIVPKDSYFVMGDNRIDSYDSRSWGFVPRKNLIGRAVMVYWPINQDNSGFLQDVSSVFAGVQNHILPVNTGNRSP